VVKINLLPRNLLTERTRQRAQSRFMLVFALIIILLVAGYGYTYMKTMDAMSKMAMLSAERVSVEAEIDHYKVYAALQSEVNSKNDLVKKAMGSPLPWVEALEEIGLLIPPNVWLTDFMLTQAAEKDGGQLTLRGLTYDHPSTARWVTALREAEGVQNVRVMFSAEEGTADDVLVRFELRAALLPGAEFEPLTGRGE
jgi:Tfp pilus assembly protein PilN